MLQPYIDLDLYGCQDVRLRIAETLNTEDSVMENISLGGPALPNSQNPQDTSVNWTANASPGKNWISSDELYLHFVSQGLTTQQAKQLVQIAENSPARKVGKGALKNVKTRFQSNKCKDPRTSESHSAELLRLYELELDPKVLTFYCQVECKGIERLKERNGRQYNHLSTAIIDLLVVGKESTWVEEIKTTSDLVKLHADKPQEWLHNDGIYSNVAHETWAKTNGISARVWSPPSPMGIYKSNLQLIVKLSDLALSSHENSAANKAIRSLEIGPRTIYDLMNDGHGFSPRIAANLLAGQNCFGLLQSVSLADIHLFYLFADQRHASASDKQALANSLTQLQPLSDQSKLTGIATNSYNRALKKLTMIRAHEAAKTKMPRRLLETHKKVLKARSSGEDELCACIPNFLMCGNRSDRLHDLQRKSLNEAIKALWENGTVPDFDTFVFRLKGICDSRSVSLPGETTIRTALRASNVAKRALATGGLRAYQAIRKSSDPADRTLPPLACGYRLHVDSSKLDNRSIPEISERLLLLAPVIYVGADATSRGARAHSLIFGSARTDGLAILIRQYVFRFGELPREIFSDRGPEMTANWLQGFCDLKLIDLSHSPTAGHTFNSPAENLIGRTNSQLSHRLAGSTLPDQAGRAVDGAFRSRSTARLQFSTISSAVGEFLNDDLEKSGPHLIEEESLALFGKVGIPQKFDEMFLIDTSPKIPLCAIDLKRGVHLIEGKFVSNDLLRLAKTENASEMRLDCVDPTRLYVRFESGWVVARSSDAQRLASFPEIDKLFFGMYAPQLREEMKELKTKSKAQTLTRVERANAASPSNAHLGPDALTSQEDGADPAPPNEYVPLFDFETAEEPRGAHGN